MSKQGWHNDRIGHQLAAKGIKAKESKQTYNGIPYYKTIDGYKFTLRSDGQYAREFKSDVFMTETDYRKFKEILEMGNNPKEVAEQFGNFDLLEFNMGAIRGSEDVEEMEEEIDSYMEIQIKRNKMIIEEARK